MRKPRTMISHVISFFVSQNKRTVLCVIPFLLSVSHFCLPTWAILKEMEKRVMIMVMLIVCMLMERNVVCYCFGEEGGGGGDQSPSTVEKAKKTTVKLMTGDAIDRDSSSSWVNWARDKLVQGFRGKQEESITSGGAQNIMGSAGNAAIKTKNTISNTASEAAELASENAGPAMNLAFAKAGEASNMASKKAVDAANLASEKAGAVKEKMAVGTDRVMDAAKQAYDTSDSETMSEEAKINYEAAKEKASQATGDLGAKMRSEL